MNTSLTFEIEEFEMPEDEGPEAMCHCPKCQAQRALESDIESEALEEFDFEEESYAPPSPAAAAPFGGNLALQQWATKLATTWARRLTTKPDEQQREMEKKVNWLAKDYEVTLAGAQKRKGLRKYSSQAIIRAWQISREQQMDFGTLEHSSYLPKTFRPPAGHVQLVSTKLVGESHNYLVAPLVVAFMQKLLQLYPQVRADTYGNHGGGDFRGRGFSIDLWLDHSPKDARGFWRPDDAVALLRAVHQAARAVGAEWRVLYNDYSVARGINQETGARRVGFVGGAFPGGGLNWHGPHPLILHFHLDLAPLSGVVPGASPPTSTISYQPRGSKPSVASGGKKFTNNPNEVVTKRTTPTPREVVAMLRIAWPELTENGARTLTAQFMGETGGGKYCFNWNLGNVKEPTGKLPHMYFHSVWEVFTPASAQAQVDKSGGLARIATDAEIKKHGWSYPAGSRVVVFAPPHPASRFRAYANLKDGAQRWLGHHQRIARQNPGYLYSVNAGDTKSVAHALKMARYYTAGEADYARLMASKKAEIDRSLGAI